MSAETTIVLQAEAFSHEDAVRVCRLAAHRSAHQIVIDLHRAREATTSAFACLILLRRTLLRDGRDLRLANLAGKTAGLYEVNRLSSVLPRL